jgi:hypothetical protein
MENMSSASASASTMSNPSEPFEPSDPPSEPRRVPAPGMITGVVAPSCWSVEKRTSRSPPNKVLCGTAGDRINGEPHSVSRSPSSECMSENGERGEDSGEKMGEVIEPAPMVALAPAMEFGTPAVACEGGDIKTADSERENDSCSSKPESNGERTRGLETRGVGGASKSKGSA